MEPTYELCQIQESIKQDKFYITESARVTAASMGFLDDDIVECVVKSLQESHFYKTMPAGKVDGLMQDVYKIAHEGRRLYVKLQINKGGNGVIVSFKEDES
jgi:motility quorum-sensing regulator / GCU-specific mRNA interferase toxin